MVSKFINKLFSFRLTAKIVLFILFGIVLPFVGVTVFLVYSLSSASFKVENNALDEATSLVKQNLQYNTSIKSETYNFVLQGMLLDTGSVKDSIVNGEFNEKLLEDFYYKNQLISSVYFINQQNHIIIAPHSVASKEGSTLDLSAIPDFDFLKSKSDKEMLGKWVGPYTDIKTKTKVFSYILPVIKKDVYMGIVGFDIAVDKLLSGIVRIDPSKSSYIFLVRNSGELIFSSDNIYGDLKIDKSIKNPTILDSQIIKSQGNSNVFTSTTEDSGLFIVSDKVSNEHDKILAFSQIPAFGGKLVVLSPLIEITQIQNDNALKSREIIDNVAVYGLIGVSAIILSVIFASYYLLNKIILKPIFQLEKGIEDLESSNFESKIEITYKDEIGELAISFNNMAVRLKEFYSGLESKIREKTHDLQEKMEELQATNNSLENMDKAMINILEDAKELEDELKVEKAGVEKKVEERTRLLTEARDEVSRGWMQLQKEKARLSSSINSLSLGFIMTDTENNIFVTNPALEKILGFEASKWTLSDITRGVEGKVDVVTQCKTCMKEKKIIELKDVIFGSKYLRIFLAPIIAAENEVIGSVILIEDITEAKVLDRSRDEFFSIASHELRTPLTSIKGNTSMIEEYYGDKLQDKELKEMIADIHESSVRLIDIVNDFLDMSRLEQGRIEFKNEVFDIVPLVEKVVYEITKLADEKNIFVKFDQPSGTLPKVYADTARTKQIIFNLLGNAIKFTANGGVTVTMDTKEKFLCIHVADTGQGIPTSSQALLFRKFVQAENNILTRDGTKGTGLGLYISRLMADGMGGSIILESSVENKGSTFTVTLPLAIDKDKETEKTVKKEDPVSAESSVEAEGEKAVTKPVSSEVKSKTEVVSTEIKPEEKTAEKSEEKTVSQATKAETEYADEESKPVLTDSKTENTAEQKIAEKSKVTEADRHEVEEIKREVKLVAEIEGTPVLPTVKPEQKVEVKGAEKEDKATGKDSEN